MVILLLSYFVFVNSKDKSVFVEENNPKKSTIPIKANTVEQVQKTDPSLVADNGVMQNAFPGKNSLNTKSFITTTQHVQKIHKITEPIDDKIMSPSTQIDIVPTNNQLVQIASTHPEAPEIPQSIAEYIPASITNKETTHGDLSSVFTEEDLIELGLLKRTAEPVKANNAWDLAEVGLDKLGKVTGTKMELDRHVDHIENATTYALAIGQFSVSRTTVK